MLYQLRRFNIFMEWIRALLFLIKFISWVTTVSCIDLAYSLGSVTHTYTHAHTYVQIHTFIYICSHTKCQFLHVTHHRHVWITLATMNRNVSQSVNSSVTGVNLIFSENPIFMALYQTKLNLTKAITRWQEYFKLRP